MGQTDAVSFSHPTARAWAEDHSLAADVRLSRLEVTAFQRHPEVYRWFGLEGVSAAQRAASPRRSVARRAGVVLLAAIVVSGVAAPVGAVAAVGGDRFEFFRMDAAVSVPLAGILFIVSALTQLAMLAAWVIRGARWSPLLTGAAVTAFVFSLFGLLSVPAISRLDGYDDSGRWYPAVVVSAVAAALAAACYLVRYRVREPEPNAEPPVLPAPDEAASRALAAVEALPAAERAAIAADRDAALAILHRRGFLGDAALARARGARLGTLFILDAPSTRGA